MTKFLLVGDVHLSDRAPSLRKETYADDILEKLDFCVKTANSLDVDALIQLGDMFHIKAPSRTSHRLVQRTHDVLSQSESPVLLIVGNHDITNDSLASLPGQPLGTLAKMSGMEILIGPHPELDVSGIHYIDDPTQTDKWAFDSRTLVCSHAAIFPDSQTPPYVHINASEYSKLLPAHTKAVAYGHIHDSHGMYKAEGKWFSNNGAISRGSLHAETINREIKVTLYDSDKLPGNPFSTIDVPYKKPEDVFYTDFAEHRKNSPIVDEFMMSMTGVSLASVTHESILHSASALLTKPQLELLEQIMNEVE